jgi:hypothetical protein
METTSQSVRKDEEISHGARVGATSQQNMRRRKKKEDDDEERKEKKREKERERSLGSKPLCGLIRTTVSRGEG